MSSDQSSLMSSFNFCYVKCVNCWWSWEIQMFNEGKLSCWLLLLIVCRRWTVRDDDGGSLVIAPSLSSKQAWWRKCVVVDGSTGTQQSALLLWSWSNGPGHGKGCWMWWPTDFCSQFWCERQVNTTVGTGWDGNKIELITRTLSQLFTVTIKQRRKMQDDWFVKMNQIACWW